MADDIFIAINADALFNKSKVYIGRALARKAQNDLDEYQLWASLALELLGKAFLAGKHPSLVVDPTHWQSLFVAAGMPVTTDVKTITAKTLFERLAHILKRFDKDVQAFCLSIAERRNAELHSGDIPFRTMKLDAWEARYWHACDLILDAFTSSLEEWLGADDAKAPRVVLEEAASALEAAVVVRLEAARSRFADRKKADREAALESSKTLVPYAQHSLFKSSYDEIWVCECPACSARAFMAGDQVSEEISEENDEGVVWEIVERELFGGEFQCPTCELSLRGSDEIEAAEISPYHILREERQMEYEPDYGND